MAYAFDPLQSDAGGSVWRKVYVLYTPTPPVVPLVLESVRGRRPGTTIVDYSRPEGDLEKKDNRMFNLDY